MKLNEQDREKLYNKVLDYFNSNKNESISFEELKEKIQVEDRLLMSILKELIDDGEIYEPEEKVYRFL